VNQKLKETREKFVEENGL